MQGADLPMISKKRCWKDFHWARVSKGFNGHSKVSRVKGFKRLPQILCDQKLLQGTRVPRGDGLKSKWFEGVNGFKGQSMGFNGFKIGSFKSLKSMKTVEVNPS